MDEREWSEEPDLSPEDEVALEQAWQKRRKEYAEAPKRPILVAPMPQETPLPVIHVTARTSLALPPPAVTRLVSTPDGARAVVSNYKGQASLWDTRHGTCLANYEHFTSPIVLSPDGTRFAAGVDHSNTVTLFTNEGLFSTTLSFDGKQPFHRVAFAPSQVVIAGATMATDVVMWSPTGQVEHVLAHEHNVHEIAFSPDTTLFATSDIMGTVALWEVGTWRLLARFAAVGDPDRFTQYALSEQLQFTADSRLLAIRKNRSGGSLLLWDIKAILREQTPLPIATYDNGRRMQSILGGRIIADIDTNSVHFFDSLTQSFLGTFTTSNRVSLGQTTMSQNIPLALSPSGTLVAIGSEATGEIWIWDLAHQHIVSTFSAYSQRDPDGRPIDPLIDNVLWNSAENMLITLGNDENTSEELSMRKRRSFEYAIKLWDVAIA